MRTVIETECPHGMLIHHHQGQCIHVQPDECLGVSRRILPEGSLVISKENGKLPPEGFAAAAEVLRAKLAANGFNKADAKVRAGHWANDIVRAYLDALAEGVVVGADK